MFLFIQNRENTEWTFKEETVKVNKQQESGFIVKQEVRTRWEQMCRFLLMFLSDSLRLKWSYCGGSPNRKHTDKEWSPSSVTSFSVLLNSSLKPKTRLSKSVARKHLSRRPIRSKQEVTLFTRKSQWALHAKLTLHSVHTNKRLNPPPLCSPHLLPPTI